MQTEINLLQQKESTQKKKSAFFKLSLFLLFLTILFTLGEIGYTYFLRSQIVSLGQDQSATLSQIKSLDAKRVKFQTLKERVLSIGKILPESMAFNNRINVLFQNIPAGIEVEEISTDLNTITLTVASSSLDQINSFLEERLPRIIRDKSIGVLKSEVDAVGINTESGYTASIELTFK